MQFMVTKLYFTSLVTFLSFAKGLLMLLNAPDVEPPAVTYSSMLNILMFNGKAVFDAYIQEAQNGNLLHKLHIDSMIIDIKFPTF